MDSSSYKRLVSRTLLLCINMHWIDKYKTNKYNYNDKKVPMAEKKRLCLLTISTTYSVWIPPRNTKGNNLFQKKIKNREGQNPYFFSIHVQRQVVHELPLVLF